MTVAKKENKSKNRYTPYSTPSWLAYPQDWISNYGRRLLAVLLQMADRKTGQLRIPKKEHTRTRGWITTAQLLKRAKMRREYFYSALEELERLSFAKRKYGRAMYSKHERLWQGRGPTEYSVDWPTLKTFNADAPSSKVPENPTGRTANPDAASSKVPSEEINTGAASSTVYDGQVVETEPQACRSSKVPVNGKSEYGYRSKVPVEYSTPRELSKTLSTAPFDARAAFAAFLGSVVPLGARPVFTPSLPKPPAAIREGVGQERASALESTPKPEPPELCPACGSPDNCEHKKAETAAIFENFRERLEQQDRKSIEQQAERVRQQQAQREAQKAKLERDREILKMRFPTEFPTPNVTTHSVHNAVQ